MRRSIIAQPRKKTSSIIQAIHALVLDEPVVGVELPDLLLQLLHHPFQLHHLSLFNRVADHAEDDGGVGAAGDNGGGAGEQENVKNKGLGRSLLCSLFPLSSFLLSQHLCVLFQVENTVTINF